MLKEKKKGLIKGIASTAVWMKGNKPYRVKLLCLNLFICLQNMTDLCYST